MAKKTTAKLTTLESMMNNLCEYKSTRNELLELTKIELITIYYSDAIEYFNTDIKKYKDYVENVLTNENAIMSVISDLEKIISNEFPVEIKRLNSNTKVMNLIIKKITEVGFDEIDNSIFHLIDVMLGEILKIKITLPDYELSKNLNDEIRKRLTTYGDSEKYEANIKESSQGPHRRILEIEHNLIRNNGDKFIALKEALDFLHANFEGTKNGYLNVVNKNQKHIEKFEVKYNVAKKELKKLSDSIESMRWEITEIYENLQSLADDDDKVLESKTKALISKYSDFMVMPVLDKNKGFIGGAEEAKSNFQYTHMLYVDDEEMGSGNILNEALNKIEEVLN